MSEEIRTGNATENSGNPQQEAHFTQEEVDKIVSARIARERKSMPTDEELTRFRAWEKNQQEEVSKRVEAAEKALNDEKTAREAAEAKIVQFERERYLTGKGVSEDDLDYFTYKIGQSIGEGEDFNTAAERFFTEHKPSSLRMSTGASLENNGSGVTREQILEIKDPVKRQEAIAQNIKLFRKE